MTSIHLSYAREGGPSEVTVDGESELVAAFREFTGPDHYMDIMQVLLPGVSHAMLEVVADGKDGDGALRYFGADGTWASQGEATGFEMLEFNFYGTPHRYPTDALIPLASAQEGLMEFVSNGGALPESVTWQLLGQ